MADREVPAISASVLNTETKKPSKTTLIMPSHSTSRVRMQMSRPIRRESPPTQSEPREADDIEGSLRPSTQKVQDTDITPDNQQKSKHTKRGTIMFNYIPWSDGMSPINSPVKSYPAIEKNQQASDQEPTINFLEQEDIQFFNALVGGIEPAPATVEAQSILAQEHKVCKRSQDAEAQQSSTRRQEEMDSTQNDLNFWLSLTAAAY